MLRSGQDIRGNFTVGGESSASPTAAHGGVSFQFPLTNQPTAPQANVIDLAGGQPVTANCGGLSGGNQQTPVAAPGQLCIYITGKTNLAAMTPVQLENVTRLGFGLHVTSGGVAGNFVANGQWAVTAP
jgi:hypothetical protein